VATSPWPGHGVDGERTPGGSKASKWACRLLTGEPGVKENAGLEATRECETGDQLSSRGKPSSRLMRLVRLRVGYRQRAGATGKATVKSSSTPRWR